MTRRAAIYIRVSTSVQAGEDRTSPQDQEYECRQLAATRGLEVVAVYKDTERYRGSDGKMKESSGEHSDRPGFRAMLADADAGAFEYILAWDDSRLFRGVSYAALELRDRVKDGTVAVEVVRGHFDAATMEIYAWAKGQEVEQRRIQAIRGLKSRLRAGRVVLQGQPTYGYRMQDGAMVVHEPEARWVRKIWQWSAEGVSRAEIRRRLIEAGAPQSDNATATKIRKHAWSFRAIDRIRYRDSYATGVQTITVGKGKKAKVANGNETEQYEMEVPTIVDSETYALCKARQAQWKKYPAGNLKNQALFAGRIRCEACGCAMIMNVTHREGKRGPKQFAYYICSHRRRNEHTADCVERVNLYDVDHEAWERIHALLTTPGALEGHIRDRVKELQAASGSALEVVAHCDEELDRLFVERQRIIGLAVKGIVTDEDLHSQLAPITAQQKALETERADARARAGDQAGDLLKLAALFEQNIRDGLDHVHEESAFEVRRALVEALSAQVTVHPDKTFDVHMLLDFGGNPEKKAVSISHPLEEYKATETHSPFALVLTV